MGGGITIPNKHLGYMKNRLVDFLLGVFDFHWKVLFSYMNKSNIFVFSLRLFCYVYARHLLNEGFGAIAGGREPVKDKKF